MHEEPADRRGYLLLVLLPSDIFSRGRFQKDDVLRRYAPLLHVIPGEAQAFRRHFVDDDEELIGLNGRVCKAGTPEECPRG